MKVINNYYWRSKFNIMTDQLLDDQVSEEANYKYAGFWTRFGAAFIDGLILIPLSLSYFLVLIDPSLIWVVLLCVLLTFIYKPFLEARNGATWGKQALGIKVLTVEGEKATTAHILKRYLLPFGYSNLVGFFGILTFALAMDENANYNVTNLMTAMQGTMLNNVLSGIGSLLSLIFGISIAVDKMSRGIHDKIGGTMVVFKN